MPETLDKCVRHVMDQGHSESSAYAICRSSMGLKSDGSEDDSDPDITEDQVRSRVAIALQFQNSPALIKDMPVCGTMGKFVNGDQKGVMTRARLAGIADRYKKYPRQVPIFMEEDHPETNDQATPVGWVEGLRMDGDFLISRSKLLGSGASAVGGDLIRGASIYTVQGKNPEGSAQGEVLKHVLLTNEPFYKNLNVAAAQMGGEPAVCVFTALPTMEGDMPDKKDEEIARLREENAALKAQTPDESVAAQLAETQNVLQATIREKTELAAANANLLADVEKLKNPASVVAMKDQMKRQERQLLAMKIRDKVKRGVNRGQFNVALVGHPDDGYDHESDEGVLAWFAGHEKFKGSMEKLETALDVMPVQTIGRQFASGNSLEEKDVAMSEGTKEYIRSLGKDPEKVAAAMKAKDAKQYAEATASKE